MHAQHVWAMTCEDQPLLEASGQLVQVVDGHPACSVQKACMSCWHILHLHTDSHLTSSIRLHEDVKHNPKAKQADVLSKLLNDYSRCIT